MINCLPVGRDNVAEVGHAMCTNLNLRKISFTGSTTVGKLLMRDCSSTIKRISLELGGNAPFIVFDDADIDVAIKALINCKFRNAGQACIASNRILVQEKIYKEFSEKLTKYVEKSMICGDGFNSTNTVGPLINQKGLEKIQDHVQSSISQGKSSFMYWYIYLTF